MVPNFRYAFFSKPIIFLMLKKSCNCWFAWTGVTCFCADWSKIFTSDAASQKDNKLLKFAVCKVCTKVYVSLIGMTYLQSYWTIVWFKIYLRDNPPYLIKNYLFLVRNHWKTLLSKIVIKKKIVYLSFIEHLI